jgi:phosphoadenosine phosphosulfate reductase
VDSWGINLVNVTSPPTGELYRTDPAACCRIHKVEPLLRALDGYAVWFTGLRREQSPTRANLPLVDTATLPSGRALCKVSPLALWQWNEVMAYLRVNEIPHAPLYDLGYTSIGCAPCTTLPTDPANARSGRWGGMKLECGIHTFAQPAQSLST